MKLASISLFLASAMPANGQLQSVGTKRHQRALSETKIGGDSSGPTFTEKHAKPYASGNILASYTSLETLKLINEHVSSKESFMGEGNVELKSTNMFSQPQQSNTGSGGANGGPSSIEDTKPVLGYVVIKTDVSNVSTEMQELASIPGVEHVERDRVMYADDLGLSDNADGGSRRHLQETCSPSDVPDATLIALDTPISGTNVGGPTVPEGFCGTDILVGSNVAWYRAIGTGNTMTASTCNDADFDTKIVVYCNCDDHYDYCIGGNDDTDGCSDFTTELSWPSIDGQEYLIMVFGYEGETGSFTLTLTDNGSPANTPSSQCDPPSPTLRPTESPTVSYSPTISETRPWGIDMVNVTHLWEIEPEEAVKICVVDTGYDLGHVDLPTDDVTGWNPEEEDYPGFGVWDVDGYSHGTHVAGTIGAIGANGVGVEGVNPIPSRFSFHIAKGLNDNGSGSTTTVLDAVQSCADAGAKVISMSLGRGGGASEIEELAYKDVYDQDILVIAAAGNSGSDTDHYPSGYKTVVSVASVQEGDGEGSDTYGLLSWFSTRNDQTEIAAPGSDVLSTIPGNNYASYDGTSMACPHVSGIAALLRSHFPMCKNNQIRNAMIHVDSVREPPITDPKNTLGWDKYYGWGIVNAGLAYELLLTKGCEGAGGTYSEPLSSMANGGSQQKTLGCINDQQCFDANVACLGEMKCDSSDNTCYMSSPSACDDGLLCTVDTCTPLNPITEGEDHMCINESLCQTGFRCDDVIGQCVSDLKTGPQAPSCREFGVPCTSGSLLEGVGASERNTWSDTFDGCPDGTMGAYLVDESVESITVTSIDGHELQAGKEAKIEAVVHAWNTTGSGWMNDFAFFYYAETVNTQFETNWQYKGFRQATGPGLQKFEVGFTPTSAGIQAIRVSLRFAPNSDVPCSQGSYDDHDDLIFTVAEGSNKNMPISPTAEDIALPALDTAEICVSLDQNECAKASPVCVYTDSGCVSKVAEE